MQKPWVRLIVFIAVLFLALETPWYVTAAILALLTIYYPLYLEILFFGFLFDTLYSVKFSFPFVGLMSAFVLLSLTVLIKPFIRI